ncbi:MAG: class IV adenylate cyclase [Phycisphaeraceae bacterium]
MSLEIEAKMRVTDRGAIERRLEELGAQHGPSILEQNTYFDSDDHQLKSTDQGLRIRVEVHDGEAQTATITHKGPRAHGKLKSRTETEVTVSDARAAAELLAALGFLPQLTFEKRRQRWTLDGCHVEMDTLPHLGEFIEIEGPSEEAVLEVRRRLDLAEAPLIRASYIAMLVSHLRENQLRTNNVRLEEERI